MTSARAYGELRRETPYPTSKTQAGNNFDCKEVS